MEAGWCGDCYPPSLAFYIIQRGIESRYSHIRSSACAVSIEHCINAVYDDRAGAPEFLYKRLINFVCL